MKTNTQVVSRHDKYGDVISEISTFPDDNDGNWPVTTPSPVPTTPSPARTAPTTTPPRRTRNSKSMYFWPLDVDEKLSDKRHTSLSEVHSAWAWWLSAECWRHEGRLPYNLKTLALMANAKNRKRFAREFRVLLETGLFVVSDDGTYIESPDIRELYLFKVAESKARTDRANKGKN